MVVRMGCRSGSNQRRVDLDHVLENDDRQASNKVGQGKWSDPSSAPPCDPKRRQQHDQREGPELDS
jgi:hypothetical protein